MFEQNKKVLAGLDGSAKAFLAAELAKNAGADISAVTLKLFDGQDSSAAREQAERLGVKWYEADYTDYFKDDVVAPFISAMKSGADAEPCALCKRSGAVKYLLDEAKRAGADKIVLGSSARITSFKEGCAVYKGLREDDSFYFALTEPHHLSKIALPLGDRAEADALKRSGACFFGGKGREGFLARYFPHEKLYLELKGELLGETEEALFKGGKKVSVLRGEFYISKACWKTGAAELKLKEELLTRVVKLGGTVFRKEEPPLSKVSARLTPKGKFLEAVLEIDFDNRAVLLFDKPVFLPSRGGIAAIYEGDRLLGGGTLLQE